MKETMVMIHGMWCGSWVWDNYKKFFEEKDYLCITPTLRHHNIAPNDIPDSRLGKVSLLDYADDLEKLIGKLDQPPIIIGHSMGGLLAQILAGRGLAEILILLAPASPAGILVLSPSAIKGSRGILSTWKFWEKPIKPTFKEAEYACLNVIPSNQREEIYEKFVHESGKALAEIGFWFFDRKHATKIDENKITCPALIIGGAKDRITPVSITRKIADKYKEIAAFKEFPNNAHWVVSEPGWETIAEEISDWIDKVMSIKRLYIEEYTEKRNSRRLGYKAPVIFSVPDSKIQYQGNMDNYSVDGVRFMSDIFLQPGSNINLRLADNAPGMTGPIAKDYYGALVIWNEEMTDARKYRVGVKLTDLIH